MRLASVRVLGFSLPWPRPETFDLCHTGNTFAPAGAAGIKDLMARMGQDSERAAIINQHQHAVQASIATSIDAWEVPALAVQRLSGVPERS